MHAHAKNTMKKALFVCRTRARRDGGQAGASTGMRQRRREKKSRRELNSVRRDRVFPRRAEQFAQTLRALARSSRPSNGDGGGTGTTLRRTSGHRARPSPDTTGGNRAPPSGASFAKASGGDDGADVARTAKPTSRWRRSGYRKQKRPHEAAVLFVRCDRISGRRFPAARRSRPGQAVRSPGPPRTSPRRTANLRRRRPR